MASFFGMPKIRWLVVSVAALAVLIASFAVPGYEPPAKAAPKPPAARHASAEAKAMAQARSTGKRVEVVEDRTARSTTFAEPTGRFTTSMTATPTRVRQKDGTWATVDETLAPSSTGYEPRVSPADVTVSDGGTGDVAQLQTGSDTSVGLTWPTALPAPTVDGATAAYAVSDGTSLQATAQTGGFSARVVLDAAPSAAPTYRFGLDLHGLTASLKDGVLRFADSDGNLVAATRPLSMWDARTDAAGDPAHQASVDAKIVATSGGGQALELTPSMTYLSDPATQYPVTIDPDVYTAPQFGDTYFYTNNTTPQYQDYRLWIGTPDSGATVYRSYANFHTDAFAGRDVLSASLDLYQYYAGSCDPQTMNVYPPTAGVTNSTVVWASQPPITTSTAWAASASFNRGLGGCPDGDGHEQVDVTKIVNGWASGELDQHGMELRGGSESNNAYEKRFCSMNPDTTRTDHCNDTSEEPQLSVSWEPQLGMQPWYSMTTHRLNDRSQLRINNDSGDAVIQAQDLRVKGVGMDLNVDRFYNGLSSDTGAFGPGWTMSVGPDVKLKRLSADRYDYQAPSGTVFGTFVRKPSDTSNFNAPNTGGLDADLHDNGDGTMTMTFRRSQEKYTFSDLAGCSDDLLQTKDVDKHGNEIDFHYDGSACGHLTSITDTAGRTIRVDYSNNRITQLTDANVSPTRTWQYGYTNGQLTSYTDPTGKITNYDWTSGQVTTITDPSQANGARPTTTLSYDSGQVIEVDYTNNGSGGVFEFDFAYSSILSQRCNGKGDYSTDVTDWSDDPGGVTTYCFKNRSDTEDRAVRVVDGAGHARTTTYTADQTASSSTDPVNDGVTNGATVYSYNPNQALTQVTEPTETSGDTPATTYFDYNNPGSVAGGSFLPTSRTNSLGHCTAFGYNGKGDLTDSWQGIVPSTGHDCSSQTSSVHTHTDYNDNGTPKDAYEDSGNGTNSADQTVYSYYDSTAGGNQGQLKQVVRPGGDQACDSSGRKLCTSYTYDGDSRATTVTDGRGKTTRYSYDADDRITQILTDGATSCTLSAGTCTQYTYDGEGNLVTRKDKAGSYAYTYDRLNQLATYTYPGGDSITTSYDGAGNLLTYTQHIASPSTNDTVTYAYNAANEAISVTDVTGTILLSPDKNGRLAQVTFPSSTGIAESFGYTKSGKVSGTTISGGTGLASYTYSYKDGSTETDQLQKATSSDGSSTSYSYGTIDRLTGADASAGTDYHYTYDGDGNLITMTAGSTTTHLGYNEADELCWSGPATGTDMARTCPATPSGNTTWTSDDAGNNTGTAAGPLAYNGANQASSLTAPAGGTTVFNGYTDQGNDLRVSAGNDTFLTGPLDVTERTVGKTSPAVTFYTRDPYGHLLDQHGAAPTRYYLIDRQNSITGMINTSGTTTATLAYDPYGAATVTSGDPGNTPWQYINSYTDTEGDTYQHLGARYYHPTIGRFTQPDSVHGCISRPDTYNPYLYANDDPINNMDASGRQSIDCIYAAIAFVLGVAGLFFALVFAPEVTIPFLIGTLALGVVFPFYLFGYYCGDHGESGSTL